MLPPPAQHLRIKRLLRVAGQLARNRLLAPDTCSADAQMQVVSSAARAAWRNDVRLACTCSYHPEWLARYSQIEGDDVDLVNAEGFDNLFPLREAETPDDEMVDMSLSLKKLDGAGLQNSEGGGGRQLK